jgi:hypothetical protein
MSVIKRSISDYWTQSIKCNRSSLDKFDFILQNINGKVLHVGCTDFPLPTIGALHHRLLSEKIDVDGYDVDKNGIETLRKTITDKKFFLDTDEITDYYDLLLIPEVIEHITNHQDFFEKMNKINFNKFIISVPNALYQNLKYSYKENDQEFIETIHPDHKCWYSPYTITFLLEDTAKWLVENVYLMHNDSQIVILGKKR